MIPARAAGGRAFLLLLAWLAAAFLGAALIAPWIHAGVGALARAIPPLEELAGYSFRRYVHRCILALALLGLWPFARLLGVRSKREVGIVGLAGHGRALAAGVLAGAGGIGVATVLVVAAGARTFIFELSAAGFLGLLAIALLSAAVVSVLEEVLFRGVLFGALRRAVDWRAALLVSSAIYSIVHFFAAPRWTEPVTWSSGLVILPRMLAGFVDPARLVPAAITLTVAGVVLGLTFQRLGHLWFAVGLHAGWVIWVRSYAELTRAVPGVPTRFWGGDIMIDGWLALGVMSLTLVGVLLWLQPPRGIPDSPGDDR